MQVLAFVDHKGSSRRQEFVANVVLYLAPGGEPNTDQYSDGEGSHGGRDNERYLATNADVVEVTEQGIQNSFQPAYLTKSRHRARKLSRAKVHRWSTLPGKPG